MEVSSPLASGIIGFRLGPPGGLSRGLASPFLLARLFWADPDAQASSNQNLANSVK